MARSCCRKHYFQTGGCQTGGCRYSFGMARRRFHLVDDSSNKFWEVWCEEATLHAHYGRIGTAGRSSLKSLASTAAAAASMERLIAEKIGKGYVEVSPEEAATAAPRPIARRVVRPPPETMDEAGFWDILDRLDWKKQGDDDKVLSPAVTALSKMSVSDIGRFEELLATKLYALDTREHARAVYLGEADPDDGDAYISPDDFLYSRCVMLVNGREAYENVVADPTLMPQQSEFEALLSLAGSAYEKKTGEGDHDFPTSVSHESFSNAEGWKPNANTRDGVATSDAIPRVNRRPG